MAFPPISRLDLAISSIKMISALPIPGLSNMGTLMGIVLDLIDDRLSGIERMIDERFQQADLADIRNRTTGIIRLIEEYKAEVPKDINAASTQALSESNDKITDILQEFTRLIPFLENTNARSIDILNLLPDVMALHTMVLQESKIYVNTIDEIGRMDSAIELYRNIVLNAIDPAIEEWRDKITMVSTTALIEQNADGKVDMPHITRIYFDDEELDIRIFEDFDERLRTTNFLEARRQWDAKSRQVNSLRESLIESEIPQEMAIVRNKFLNYFLPAMKEAATNIQYRISTRTGTRSGAQTNDDVFIVLEGRNGGIEIPFSSLLYKNNKSIFEKHFRSGDRDELIFYAKDIGRINRIGVLLKQERFEGRFNKIFGIRDNWFCDSVSVKRFARGGNRMIEVTFTARVNSWVTIDEVVMRPARTS